jgi:ParB-like chromosome segregation protein Spo0J
MPKTNTISADENIQFLDPKKLIPYKNNSKLHSKDEIEKLAKIIKANGFDVPIVIDEDNVIIKGHKRREAAISLNKSLVPVIIRSGLTQEQKVALRISDNRVSESPWIQDALLSELHFLEDREYDLELTGFSTDELDELLKETEQLDYQPGQIFGASGNNQIPEDNQDIDEGELTNTKHKCPSCGFQW